MQEMTMGSNTKAWTTLFWSLGLALLSGCGPWAPDNTVTETENAEAISPQEAAARREDIPMVIRRSADLTPPVAEKRPMTIDQHGIERTDSYGWLRDENWQEVLRDPSTLNADIRRHLEAEVAYYQEATAHLSDLRATLVSEMRGRIKEDESAVPMPDGPYAYYVRYREGGDYPVYARRPRDGGDEDVIYDGDAERGDASFFDIGGVDVSPDHRLLAYSIDRLGSEYFDMKIRQLDTGKEYDEVIPSTDGDAVWAADSQSFFYVERDDNQRPKRVKHHILGTPPTEDRLVYEEPDDAMFLGIDETSSEAFLIIGVGNGVTSEARVIPLDDPMADPVLIAPRIKNQLYDVDHRGDHFYIRTNADEAVNFKIVRAPVEAPGRENWEDFIPHRSAVFLSGFVPFKDYIVRGERENALPRLIVGDYDGNEHSIAFDEAAYALGLDGWGEFDTELVRFSYESPTTPEQIFDYNMRTRERTLRKTQTVPSGHDPSLYTLDNLHLPAQDGETIPVTVLRLKTIPLDGSAPLLLYGYGAYGAYIPDSFSTSVLSLVDRGVVYALAHIRGGSAKGRQWYLDGKLDKKQNSFSDFNDAARALIDRGYTEKGRIVAYGGSAGGLLVGAAVNRAPDLYGGILAAVPFVDVLTTISDAELPLTPPEWDEWGNPITEREQYDWIAAYSPYDNIKAGAAYPPILATGGLTDYRVTYWEPAKWIARLREEATGGPFLLRMNMEAGHGGSAARFERLEERAHLYAFALDLLGKGETTPVSHQR
ncbi:peptidase S9, prolyl oligopeptidase [Parvularcula bermudensis HTCC2503]|uniref:Peptidase S9, prolyl oligopeptidase n=2 Tax=Parvularcula TaxID=208215 RepID=E0TFP7_PARBH|nr:peptidase S9, prolyl oligopeptidase [Parvularcula bermudensis HTCC2503]